MKVFGGTVFVVDKLHIYSVRLCFRKVCRLSGEFTAPEPKSQYGEIPGRLMNTSRRVPGPQRSTRPAGLPEPAQAQSCHGLVGRHADPSGPAGSPAPVPKESQPAENHPASIFQPQVLYLPPGQRGSCCLLPPGPAPARCPLLSSPPPASDFCPCPWAWGGCEHWTVRL